MNVGDIVKLSERYLEYYPAHGILREKAMLRKFRVLKFLPNDLIQVRRLDTKMQDKEIYRYEFLKEIG